MFLRGSIRLQIEYLLGNCNATKHRSLHTGPRTPVPAGPNSSLVIEYEPLSVRVRAHVKPDIPAPMTATAGDVSHPMGIPLKVQEVRFLNVDSMQNVFDV